ncbi:MAG: hypothetical protein H6632_13535 [Anaerolineales bacterium]|nr:hypothetical protein [Anaerolineales bacterium]
MTGRQGATYNTEPENLGQAIPAAQRQATVHRIEQGGYRLILAANTTEFNYVIIRPPRRRLDHPSYQGF